MDRFTGACERLILVDSHPAQEITRACRKPEIESPVAELVQRPGLHGHLCRVKRIGVDDARADLDPVRRQCTGCQERPDAAQEQVVTHPELAETCLLGSQGKPWIIRCRQVVVHPNRKFQLWHGVLREVSRIWRR